MATYHNPKDRSVNYADRAEYRFRIVVLDTGTDRPGLENRLTKYEEMNGAVSILQKAATKYMPADIKTNYTKRL
jgi:hypothetical protein